MPREEPSLIPILERFGRDAVPTLDTLARHPSFDVRAPATDALARVESRR
jgi:hypothetical protein